jgi:Beta protein
MTSQTHYVPLLKGRRGEYDALATLDPSVRSVLTPLIEIPPIPWNFEEDRPEKTIDSHLAKIGKNFERSWPLNRPFYVDMLWIPESERMNDGEHPVEYVARAAREWTLSVIPVVSLIRGPEYLQACRSVFDQDKQGVCLRIQKEDFIEFTDLEAQVLGVLEALSASPRSADLILDLRSIAPPQQVDPDSAINLIAALPRLSEWRSFIIAATSFPRDLMGLPPSESSPVDRTEWALWRGLRQRGDLPRPPIFGDYAISHPEPSEVDPRVMRPSASVRYTTENSWIVLKGRNLRDNGYEEFHSVCRALLARSEYSGPTFSWGDAYIADCAYERRGPGNLTTWRSVGTSHHLTFAVRQIATEFGL